MVLNDSDPFDKTLTIIGTHQGEDCRRGRELLWRGRCLLSCQSHPRPKPSPWCSSPSSSSCQHSPADQRRDHRSPCERRCLPALCCVRKDQFARQLWAARLLRNCPPEIWWIIKITLMIGQASKVFGAQNLHFPETGGLSVIVINLRILEAWLGL